MRISSKGFPEAIARLKQLGDVPQTRRFRGVLVDALEPIRDDTVSNVHSISGRTVMAIVTAEGKGREPSAYIKVDRKIATALWRLRLFAYPYAVESGHGGPRPAPPHPFFRKAFLSARSRTRSLLRDGIQELLHPYMTTMSIAGEFS